MQNNQEFLEKYPYYDHGLSINERIYLLLKRLTLKEKFKLLSGKHFSWWLTKPIRRLKIKPMGMTDGPNGVSFHSSLRKNTKFPCTKCMSATWNQSLAEKCGQAIAEEVRAVGKHILLAPGINIDRTPLNGRTFEYYSEDPYLTKELAIPYIKGVQSQKIGACVKHYAVNNQEINRRKVSVEVGERTLREIYLRAFEEIVKKADPWIVMGSYNKINGIYGCENKELIRDLLMDQWGFNGYVVSDWFASRTFTDPEKSIKAGLSLEMPKPYVYKMNRLKKAFRSRKFTEKELDFVIERLLRVMFQVGLFDLTNDSEGKRNTEEHKKIAREIAEAGMVLLKNENNILPLDKTKIKSIAVVGPNATKKMGKIHYGGSAAVIPPYETIPLEGIKGKCGIAIKIVNNPEIADICLFIGGLNHNKGQDCENADRTNLELPEEQIELLEETIKQNKKTIVVLINGSPISMKQWHEKVPAILEAWHPGQEGGHVIADILFGDVNPSGKLPITFPKALKDSPAHKSSKTYPGNEKVYYEEGIYVGYRYFDKEKIDPLYPFGYGLSYTTFSVSNVKLSTYDLVEDELMKITLNIENKGERTGSEVIQLSIGNSSRDIYFTQQFNYKTTET